MSRTIDSEAVGSQPIAATGRHQRQVSRNIKTAVRGHGLRLTSFSLIGATVFVLGAAFQGMLIHTGASPDWSYAGQAIFSIELSFVLNRWLTWRKRSVNLLSAAAKWNTQRLALTVPNFVGYAILVRAGLNWLAANIAVTALFTIVNYVGADLWSFRNARRARTVPLAWWLRAPLTIAHYPYAAIILAYSLASAISITLRPRRIEERAVPQLVGTRLPSVSLVIPCKDNADTIRATVIGILDQDYAALDEVILVGSTGDKTWSALEGITDPRLIILEQEPVPGKRDPAVKRDKGIRKAKGEVIALADSDIVMDEDWLSRAVGVLIAQGGGVVAGGMRSIHDTFWGRFVDRNRLGAKTPRVPAPYHVTRENFGRHNRKPPITANAVFTRDVYESAQFNPRWSFGYEDYEWFWRVAKAGHPIWFSDQLHGRHHHRRSFRQLVTEYQRAAHGCAQFIRSHPDSPLARKRRRQAFFLPLAALAGVAAAVATALAGYTLPLAGAVVAGLALLAIREFAYSRTAESLTYPFAGGALAAVFTTSLVHELIRPTAHEGKPANSVSPPRRLRQRIVWPLAAIMTVQVVLSLNLIWSNTAFGDEANYLWVGHIEWAHWLHGASVPSYIADTLSGSPVLYPPLGAIANTLGGLPAARVLSLIFMLSTTALLYLTTTRLFGRNAALASAAVWSVCESALRLAFATYDALSVLWLALAAWFAVQAACRRHRGEFVAATAVALALAMATAYSALGTMPIATGFAVIVWVLRIGKRQAIMCAGWLIGATSLAYGLLMTAGHSWRALSFTVLSRSTLVDKSPPLLILEISWRSIGLIVVLAAIGALVAATGRQRKTVRILLIFLVVAGFVVTLEQIKEDTAWSLDKHLAYSGWFAAIAAGYCISTIARVVPVKRWVTVSCCGLALLFPAVQGEQGAWTTFHLWPSARTFLRTFVPLAAHTSGSFYLSSETTIGQYYTKQGLQWHRWRCQGMSLRLGGKQSTWEAYYRHTLQNDSCNLIVLFYNTSLGLPGNAILGQSRQRELLNLVAKNANPPAPGLSALTLMLEADPAFKLKAIGPYNDSDSTGAYAIWQRRGKGT